MQTTMPITLKKHNMKKYIITALAAAVIPFAASAQMKVNVNIDSDITGKFEKD